MSIIPEDLPMCWTFHLPMCWASPLTDVLNPHLCFPWKGSGGGVVYGFGVWRVKSWVKNVLNANKYIAISPIKWGWSPLTYLPLVVIIFKKSIILFYWIPFRGLMLAIKNLFIFWPLLNPLYGIDTTMREWGIRNEEWAIIFLGWTGEAGLHLITHC